MLLQRIISSFAATTSPPWPATFHGGIEAGIPGPGAQSPRGGRGHRPDRRWMGQRVGSGSSELMEGRHRCGPTAAAKLKRRGSGERDAAPSESATILATPAAALLGDSDQAVGLAFRNRAG
uniref:Uncharacterized protein n=1 Tax=Setaria italica TaxID=4555 RepID=K4AGR5_SETIT